MQKEPKEKIKEFIVNNFLKNKPSPEDSEHLFESNTIDSINMLELMAFIQKEFRISIGPSEVKITNFSSINKITQFIEQKQKKLSENA